MRKLMLAVMAVVLCSSMSSVSFAAEAQKSPVAKEHEAVRSIKGTITAINTVANQITINQDKSGVATTVTLPAGEVASLKEGAHVKVTLKAGSSDQATGVKVIEHKHKK